MEERIAVLETQMVEFRTDIGEIKTAVCGNGKPGLKTRVDRLEQRRLIIDWVLKIVIGGILGIVIAQLFQ